MLIPLRPKDKIKVEWKEEYIVKIGEWTFSMPRNRVEELHDKTSFALLDEDVAKETEEA